MVRARIEGSGYRTDKGGWVQRRPGREDGYGEGLESGRSSQAAVARRRGWVAAEMGRERERKLGERWSTAKTNKQRGKTRGEMRKQNEERGKRKEERGKRKEETRQTARQAVSPAHPFGKTLQLQERSGTVQGNNRAPCSSRRDASSSFPDREAECNTFVRCWRLSWGRPRQWEREACLGQVVLCTSYPRGTGKRPWPPYYMETRSNFSSARYEEGREAQQTAIAVLVRPVLSGRRNGKVTR